MARRMFPKAAQKLWEKQFDWVADTWRLALMSSTWVYDEDAEFFSQLTGVVATAEITSKTNVEGLLDAADVVYTALSGSQITQLVIYKSTGVSSTSPVVWHINDGNGLPFTPDGSDLTVAWDNGPNKAIRQGNC